MIELNLETKTKEQEIIKDYLQKNASENLAKKINNGVKVQKDEKTLLNKKDLDGFIKFATDEARKQAEKGATCACIEDSVVFGWAIHYFEEDEIIGTLYNEDGSLYEEKPKIETKPKVEPKVEVKQKPQEQQTMFDFINLDNKPQEETKPETTEDNIPDYYKLYAKTMADNPNSITLIRLRDFYEAFDENAELISNILHLIQTTKDFGFTEPVKFAGFPFHAKDNYFEKLRKQYSLIVLENEQKTVYEKINTELEDNSKLNKLINLFDNQLIIKE